MAMLQNNMLGNNPRPTSVMFPALTSDYSTFVMILILLRFLNLNFTIIFTNLMSFDKCIK